MSDPALRVRLSAGYGKTRVLDGLELDLQQGECLGLAGSSGAGKSTLVLALLGLLPWRRGWVEGEVILGGRNLLALNEREARQVRGCKLALVPQSPLSALNPALSLRTQFREAWRAHRPDFSGLNARVADLLRQVHLPAEEAFLDRKPGQISVGQAQRVVLALALLHKPSVLIADEPTSALDPATQVEILRLLRQIQEQEGTTLLYISHDLVSILQLCEKLAVLQGGRIAEAHPVRKLGYPVTSTVLRPFFDSLPAPVDVIVSYLKSPLRFETKVANMSTSDTVDDLNKIRTPQATLSRVVTNVLLR